MTVMIGVMATYNLLVILCVAGIPLWLLLTRTHATLFLLMLFAGSSLSLAAADEASLLLATAVRLTPNIEMAVRLVIFFLPGMVMVFHYRKSAGRKLWLHLMPLLLSGLVALYLLMPLLTMSAQKAIKATTIYGSVEPYQDLVITASVLFSMFVAITMYKKTNHGKESKAKHKA